MTVVPGFIGDKSSFSCGLAFSSSSFCALRCPLSCQIIFDLGKLSCVVWVPWEAGSRNKVTSPHFRPRYVHLKVSSLSECGLDPLTLWQGRNKTALKHSKKASHRRYDCLSHDKNEPPVGKRSWVSSHEKLICGEKAQLRIPVDCLKFLLSTQFDNIVSLWNYLPSYMETLPEGTFCSSPLIQPSSWLHWVGFPSWFLVWMLASPWFDVLFFFFKSIYHSLFIYLFI